jgi:hypothetical protein
MGSGRNANHCLGRFAERTQFLPNEPNSPCGVCPGDVQFCGTKPISGRAAGWVQAWTGGLLVGPVLFVFFNVALSGAALVAELTVSHGSRFRRGARFQ